MKCNQCGSEKTGQACPKCDRTPVWDDNKTADRLFDHKGGYAIWYRNGELGARAAIRKGGCDVTQITLAYASLTVTMNHLAKMEAEKLGISEEDFMGMVKIAIPMVEQVSGLTARIRPSGPPKGG